MSTMDADADLKKRERGEKRMFVPAPKKKKKGDFTGLSPKKNHHPTGIPLPSLLLPHYQDIACGSVVTFFCVDNQLQQMAFCRVVSG